MILQVRERSERNRLWILIFIRYLHIAGLSRTNEEGDENEYEENYIFLSSGMAKKKERREELV